jgi:uracil-DNA glycosylase family 4
MNAGSSKGGPDVRTVARQLKARLALEKSFGLDVVPRGTAASDGRADSFDAVFSEVSRCALCPLQRTRTNTVFGVGDPKARLMFIGEAPGADEDRLGEPFVGRAGKLLTELLGEIGLKRGDVFIANVLKCRPPENRNPMPLEIARCGGYLMRQIVLIRPRVICALGKFAAQFLLRSEAAIGSLRGRFYEIEGGFTLLPSFHPAYLLRSPSDMDKVREDFRKLKKAISAP